MFFDVDHFKHSPLTISIPFLISTQLLTHSQQSYRTWGKKKLDSWLEVEWQWKQIQKQWLCVKVFLQVWSLSVTVRWRLVNKYTCNPTPKWNRTNTPISLILAQNQEVLTRLDMITNLDVNTLAVFWTCTSYEDGMEDVKQRTQGRRVAKDTHSARKESVEADPEADWPSCPQSGQTQALWGLWNVTGISGGNSQHSLPKKKKKKKLTFSSAEASATKEKTQHPACQFPFPLSDF